MEIELLEDKALNNHIADVVDIAFDYVRSKRACKGISDRDFTILNISRALSDAHSGRDFLQEQFDRGNFEFGFSTYFDALASLRRLNMFREVTNSLYKDMQETMLAHKVDHLDIFPELRDRVIIAGDGHCIEHACHAKKRKSGRFACESSIHLLDLHTGLVNHLTIVQGNGDRAHEMPVLREAIQTWRAALPKQSKPPILIYDRAAIDKIFWSRMARAKNDGVKVITRPKVNMVFSLRCDLPVDTSLEVNKGIIKLELVGQENSAAMRLITYLNPEDGIVYEFLTTADDLEPGVVAWLYFLRWKIEKCFDVFKNKMYERKGWATSSAAQEIQARACCAAYNLLQVFKLLITERADLKKDKLQKKRARNLESRECTANKKGLSVHPFQYTISHLYQLSQQFIRLIRNLLLDTRTLRELLPLFRKRMELYL